MVDISQVLVLVIILQTVGFIVSIKFGAPRTLLEAIAHQQETLKVYKNKIEGLQADINRLEKENFELKAILRFNNLKIDITKLTAGEKAKLRKSMANVLDINDIRVLCYDLDIDYENIEGDTLETKIIDLIETAVKLGKLNSLIYWLEENYRNWRLE